MSQLLIEPELRIQNRQGGVKADGLKLRPTLLLKSMPNAVNAVIKVLDDGAKKYTVDNWKKVEPERYEDAMLRHTLSYLNGDKHDLDSGSHHLAHAACCILFMLELELSNTKIAT